MFKFQFKRYSASLFLYFENAPIHGVRLSRHPLHRAQHHFLQPDDHLTVPANSTFPYSQRSHCGLQSLSRRSKCSSQGDYHLLSVIWHPYITLSLVLSTHVRRKRFLWPHICPVLRARVYVIISIDSPTKTCSSYSRASLSNLSNKSFKFTVAAYFECFFYTVYNRFSHYGFLLLSAFSTDQS